MGTPISSISSQRAFSWLPEQYDLQGDLSKNVSPTEATDTQPRPPPPPATQPLSMDSVFLEPPTDIIYSMDSFRSGVDSQTSPLGAPPYPPPSPPYWFGAQESFSQPLWQVDPSA